MKRAWLGWLGGLLLACSDDPAPTPGQPGGQSGGSQAGQSGQSGQAGQAGQAGQSGQAGQAPSGQGGGVCFVPEPPAGAECTQDSDCGVSDSPDCEEVRCDTCLSWTCLRQPINPGQKCQLAATKCHGGGEGFCAGTQCYVSNAEYKQCPYFGEPCSQDQCNPLTGECEPVPFPDGSSCLRTGNCYQGATCQQGQCQGGELIDCAVTGNPCVAGTCNVSLGYCTTSFTDKGACDDGNLCTTGDVCDANLYACAGSPKTLDCSMLDQGGVMGACLPATGECGAVARPAGALCTVADACQRVGETDGFGLCVPETPPGHVIWSESFHTGAKDWLIQSTWAAVSSIKVSQVSGTSVQAPYQESVSNPELTGLMVAVTGYGYFLPSLGGTSAEGPAVDLSGEPGPVRLSFRRWRHLLATDQTPVSLLVEVFDGAVWSTAATLPLSAWTPEEWGRETVDVSAAKNKNFRVRFRYALPSEQKSGAESMVSLDEVQLLTDCAP